MIRLTIALLVLLVASPAAAQPWWQTYTEARRRMYDRLEQQQDDARARRYARCRLNAHNPDRCVRAGGRRDRNAD